jgi:hypothetical protein
LFKLLVRGILGAKTHSSEDLHAYEECKYDDINPIKIEFVTTLFGGSGLFVIAFRAPIFRKLFFQFVYLILVGIICHKA